MQGVSLAMPASWALSRGRTSKGAAGSGSSAAAANAGKPTTHTEVTRVAHEAYFAAPRRNKKIRRPPEVTGFSLSC